MVAVPVSWDVAVKTAVAVSTGSWVAVAGGSNVEVDVGVFVAVCVGVWVAVLVAVLVGIAVLSAAIIAVGVMFTCSVWLRPKNVVATKASRATTSKVATQPIPSIPPLTQRRLDLVIPMRSFRTTLVLTSISPTVKPWI